MSVRSLFQVLAEPDVREALSLGIADIFGELRSSAFIGTIGEGCPSDDIGDDPHSAAGDIFSTLALKDWSVPAATGPMRLTGFVFALLYEMKRTVGLVSDDAVILIDGMAKVHGMNRTAERLATSGFFFVGRTGGLKFSDRGPRMAFRKNLGRFFEDAPERLRVLVGKEVLMVFRQAAPGMATLTIRHIAPLVVEVETVQKVLGVSPMQARVAQAVMRGLGPVEYAKESGCTVKTARFHLYQLMKRLDVHSQGALLNFLVRIFA